MTDIVHGQRPKFDQVGQRKHAVNARSSADPLAWARVGFGATMTLLATAIVFGFLLRVAAALNLSPHVDEASSVLAAHVVADRGIPLLPSGTPYFQGFTLSYLLLPFVWLGVGEIHHLPVMRMLLVVAGAATIYLCYRFGRSLTGDPRVGAIMAMLVAIDPVSVQWSSHVRMYGLLQGLAIALVWAYIVLLKGNTGWRQLALVIAIYWAAAFTHVGASLMGVGMAVAALLVYRRAIFRQTRLLVTLALSALGSVTLLGLNNLLGTENEPVQESSSVPFWSFVGDNLLSPLARLRLPLDDWQSRITAGVTLYWLVPMLIVLVSTIIGARYLLRSREATEHTRTTVITLLAFYWVPIVLILVFTVSPKVRYFLHLHLIGYFFLAVLLVEVLRRAAAARAQGRLSVGVLARYGTVAAVVLASGSGLLWRLNNPVVHPDYNGAMAYVAEYHEPGQPVIITLPPIGYLSVDEAHRDDVFFLAGSEGWTRADRYTRWAADGRLIDYWIGADSIVSTRTLGSILEEYPDAWIIADDDRLRDDWTNQASIKRVISDSMFPAYSSDGGAVVYRTTPAEVQESGEASIEIESEASTSDALPAIVQCGPSGFERAEESVPCRVSPGQEGTEGPRLRPF